VSQYLQNVDEPLVALVDRCLRRDRTHRFASAEELAAQLDAFLGERGRSAVGADEDGEARSSRPSWTGAEVAAVRGLRRTIRMTSEDGAAARRAVAGVRRSSEASCTTLVVRVCSTVARLHAGDGVGWSGKLAASLLVVVLAGIILGAGIARRIAASDARVPAAESFVTIPAAPASEAPALSQPAASVPAEPLAPERAALPVSTAVAQAKERSASGPREPVHGPARPVARNQAPEALPASLEAAAPKPAPPPPERPPPPNRACPLLLDRSEAFNEVSNRSP
jgi:hypothetical protein